MRFLRNVFTFGLYNPNILKQPYRFAIMHSNQTSQDLRSMSKISLENDIFHSKNITFHNHMMTFHIFSIFTYTFISYFYMLVIHLSCLS